MFDFLNKFKNFKWIRPRFYLNGRGGKIFFFEETPPPGGPGAGPVEGKEVYLPPFHPGHRGGRTSGGEKKRTRRGAEKGKRRGGGTGLNLAWGRFLKKKKKKKKTQNTKKTTKKNKKTTTNK